MRATAALIALTLPAAVSAQGLIIPRCPPPRLDMPVVECFPVRPAVVRTLSDVRVELRDRVMRYEVEERFVNRGGGLGEADYVFPLPHGAAFRDLKLSIDGQLVAGETMNAADARRIYEDIVRRHRDPALVEWMGHGMLRTRIFPFNAGEERRVVVRFEAVAPREGDAVRIDYFRGSRRSALGAERVVGIRELTAESREPGAESRFQLTYRAGSELGDAYSPTHELDIDRSGAERTVRVRGGGADVTVLVALRRSASASVSVLANARRDEPGYALLSVTLPSDIVSTRLPRDVTLVLDVSGSMSGHKLEQAKAAGRQLLRTLGPDDRFRLVDFSTDVRTFREGYSRTSEENLRAAERYLDALEATGSTNISGALEEALGSRLSAVSSDGREPGTESREPNAGNRLSLVLFMTDGAATVGERDPAAIAARAARLRRDARVFTFGIGGDVNVGLVEQLALEGRGTPHFVRPEENVERAVGVVASQLRQPLLTDVRVTVDGPVRLSRVYPTAPIDVFAGEDLVLLARYDGGGEASVVVEGRSGTRAVRWSTIRAFPAEEFGNAFVPRLWATQRIGWLTSEKRKNGGSPEIDSEIRQLGERFGIPTEFTSYLVKEPGMVAQAMPVGRPGLGGDGRVRQAIGAAGVGSAAPASPSAQAVAFEAARAAAEQRAAKSIATADMSVDSVDATLVKRAGTRAFKKDGERWTDSRMKAGLPVYKVMAYSPTYFALLDRLPELRQAFAIGDRVLVAGRGVAIEIVESAPDLTGEVLETVINKW